MSLQRVVLTAEQLRNYKPNCPPMTPHPLQAIFDRTSGSCHVTAQFAYAVAVDLLGIQLATTYVKNTPGVLHAWINLLETYGWGNHVRRQDVQVNLILNAIKATVNTSQAEGKVLPHQRESEAFKLILEASEGDQALELVLVNSLILEKGLDLPWTIVATLSDDPSDTAYGTFALPK